MSHLATSLCRVLDLEHPIVQAPVGASPELTAAVSEAGGLGTLSVTWTDPEESRAKIRETQARTERPFGVNIVLDPASKQRSTEDALEVALAEDVDVFSFSFGDPAPYVGRIHDADGVVMQTVGSAAQATEAVDAGVDIVVAQGWEAGGHVQSDVASLPLVPRVVDAVEEQPVVAAGGIADGRGIAAVLALGAAGAWLGTRFLLTEEATKHPEYQQRVLEATETETELTELFDVGWPDAPHRVVRTETVERWENAGRPSTDRPGEDDIVGKNADGEPIHRYEFRSPSDETVGDIDEMALYAGQSAGLMTDLPDAATVVDRLVSETTEAITTLPTVDPD